MEKIQNFDFGELEEMAAFGVAGNFAGHLEQAGEAKDFVNVKSDSANAPKALFPTYLPASAPNAAERIPARLLVFPFDAQTIIYPRGEQKIQLEPECAIICEAEWSGAKVEKLSPVAFAASNDCSIRKEGAAKISQKKNWGKSSKGLSRTLLPIDKFSAGGVLDDYRIASFLLRSPEACALNGGNACPQGGNARPAAQDSATAQAFAATNAAPPLPQVFDYGEDSAVSSYSYIYEQLVEWIVRKLNTQADEGPAENVNAYLLAAGRPERLVVSIGATRYTAFGETNFLHNGDKAAVVLYPQSRYTHAQIAALVQTGEIAAAQGVSALVQTVVS